ncbi:aminodeoxychorismate synthase component I [Alteriqipengyuania lutimaris]|uniref:Probable branched-chain-amino-acid aminotransferase n=1 Tax=Alteriqipengyuania lutimaris TaxID=1538146 RepID=A0A395LJQ9_9SPHN|nr:aminodeoxychorismate synthase component I [Alteriqipengyuania lutimaris]MBB3034162.1 para-aminobenzoate synthetase/4-amino-4-deoxychorismate lyase [Alteriqipengyuania lutimaris]RDS76909.1 aminodeoxychorismate synthase component I [Alteriqipengyuania lutimaris]
MATAAPFILLDDARPAQHGGATGGARLFEDPLKVFRALRPDEVEDVLAQAEAAQAESGGVLAGYLAYEAGLALEPKLRPLADGRTGAAGPLVWLGLFESERAIPAGEVDAWLAERAPGTASLGPLEPAITIGEWQARFAQLQEAIAAGDLYQANLTLPLTGACRGDPLALYRELRKASDAGHGGVVWDGSHALVSLSPELFFEAADGRLTARPMKGTRPRHADPAEDRKAAQELAESEKDRAENLMIVDLMRNDLSRVAKAGSVRVEEPFAVQSFPTVHQMVSTVRADLRDDAGLRDIVTALFPCGSITGAPKIRAMELIDRLERDARGAYCGAIGAYGADGTASFNVAIRTLRITPTENGHGTAVLGVGAGIVADSEPLAEWREAQIKAGFARASGPECRAPAFDLIETMRFDPEEGIPLLEGHLARLSSSAHELGFAFDRHAARNQIQALCFELSDPARVRLVCARSGTTAIEVAPLPATPTAPLDCIALPLPVAPGDWRLRHKTTDRGFYADALAAAHELDAHEALLVRDDGLVTEGSWTSVFVERDGTLVTPPLALGLLPGVLRDSLIAEGRAVEGQVTLGDLENGFWIGNALRGLMQAQLV